MGIGSAIKKAGHQVGRTAHGLGSKAAGVSHKIWHAADENRWLKLGDSAAGMGFFKEAYRSQRDGISKDSLNALATSMSPIATYFTGNQTDRRAAGIDEDAAHTMGMSKEDALVAEIRRAYGMDDNGGAIENNLRNALNDVDHRLNKGRNVVQGEERASAERAHKQFATMLAQLVRARGANAGTLNKAQVAINALGARGASVARRDANRELDTRLAADVTRQNAAAYTRGVSGSSFDEAAKAKAVADYGLGRNNIANTLAESDRTFRDTLDSQRRGLEDRARAVGRDAIDDSAIATDQHNAAKVAYSNLTGRSLGQLLATGSDLAVNDQVQRASGNLGFRGLMGAPAFTASRSTGGSLTR